jgi:hypothetical protein
MKMATKTLYFPEIENGWTVTYFFQAIASFSYKVTLKDNSSNDIILTHEFNNTPPYRISDLFSYNGKSGNLICTIECPSSNHFENTWAESIITPNSGKPTMGRTYCAAFDDYGGPVRFSNFFVCLFGWV